MSPAAIIVFSLTMGCQSTDKDEDINNAGEEDSADESIAYTNEELDYFLEVAMNIEFGDGGGRIHKWLDDVFIVGFYWSAACLPVFADRQRLLGLGKRARYAFFLHPPRR